MYKHFTFSGGEEHVTLEGRANPNWVHRIESSTDLVNLAMLRDAWQDEHYGKPSVTIPYFPYARQDRVCNVGEAHSLRVVCNMLKAMDFQSITTYDIHSDVAFGILPNLVSVPRHTFMSKNILDTSYGNRSNYIFGENYDVLISPDGGALKHVYQDAKALGIAEVVTANKVRDVSTGDIVMTEVMCDDLRGTNVLITDDICDGGRTFIELAKVLKETHKVKTVDLFVTHGIFSAGLGNLTEYIDHVYTTDTRTNSTELLGKFKASTDLQDYLTVLPIVGE